MKKTGLLILAVLLLLSLAACRRRTDEQAPQSTGPVATAPTTLPETTPTLPNEMPTLETNIPDPNVDPENPETEGATDHNQETTGAATRKNRAHK